MAQSTLNRPPAVQQKQRSEQKASMSSILTLANWQLRQTWRLLIVIGVSLLTAVVLVCAIPLYVQVSLSAGLRHTLAENPQDRYLTMHAQSPLFSANALQSVQQELGGTLHTDLGSAVSGTPALSVHITLLPQSPHAFLNVIGEDVGQVGGHVTLLQGRLPALSSGDTIEFAATAKGVHDLHLQLGKLFTLPYQLSSPSAPPGMPPLVDQVKLRLVGIIAPTDASDVFWHTETFMPTSYKIGLTGYEALPVLAANSEVTRVLTQFSAGPIQQNNELQFVNAPDIYWYYPFNFAQLDVNQLPHLISGLTSALSSISSDPVAPPYVVNTTSLGPLSTLQDYAGRATVLELPASCLAYLIAGLVLFFVLLMTDVLVERQVAAIALLRSRGASAHQVFGALLTQGMSLCLLAFVAGPLLAILGVVALANMALDASERGALDLITAQPVQIAQGQLERDLIVVGLALLGMILAIWRVLRGNVLILNRESARSTHKPFWMRFKLDLLAAVAALAAFGFSLYIESPGVLDVRTHALILPLTSLVGVVFLLVGCLLLFLRFFPALLNLMERVAARRRGAAPVLALAQMARSPRQSLRMVLLLALAVAFALFTLTFNQTQAQRLTDIATYQVGGDFSGSIPSVLQGDTWNNQLAFYQGIKGITSVTLGTSTVMTSGANTIPLSVNAVDSSTYARTIYWTEQNGSQSLGTLTSVLQRGQAQAEQKNVIPAIIDDAAARALNVGMGQSFSLSDYHGSIHFVVAGIVHYLPTVYDATSGTGADTSIPEGGILVDFQTFSAVEFAMNQNGIAPTQVWLRSSTQPSDLANVRGNLFSGTYALDNGEDRRALTQSLATDPLYGSLIGILVLGAVVALLLGLVGNLLVSWWNARSRRTNFAVLRALGCAPGQIASVLLWEQSIVYGAGLLLGAILSIVCSLVILPAFIFSPTTGAGSSEAFYVAQSVPPVQTVFPLWPMLSVLVGLVIICALVLGLMLRVVIHSHVSQTLRLDED